MTIFSLFGCSDITFTEFLFIANPSSAGCLDMLFYLISQQPYEVGSNTIPALQMPTSNHLKMDHIWNLIPGELLFFSYVAGCASEQNH